MNLAGIAAVIRELLLLGSKILALYREAKAREWIKEGQLLSEKLKDAKTDEDRANLARALFGRRHD